MPSPGLVRALGVPGGPGVRDDRGVVAGFEIPVFYDSLISKLVVWGETRADAIARLGRALDEYRVVGVQTTVPFFQWLIRQREFLERRFDTTYLDGVLAERARAVVQHARAARSAGRGDRRRARRVVPRASCRRRSHHDPAAPGSAPRASRACDDVRGRDQRRDHDGRDRAASAPPVRTAALSASRSRERAARRHARATRSRPRGPTSACRCCSPPTIAALTSR